MTSGPNGASFDHLIGQLDRRLARIESALDLLVENTERRHDRLNGRIADLEKKNAEASGGWKVAGIIGGVAGTLGGIAAKWFSNS